MEIITREYKVYNYSELSAKAKEKVKQWYLDDELRPQEFEDIYTRDLKYFFGNSDLKMQFSLAGCQGDGLNIYGKLDLLDVFDALKNVNYCDSIFKKYATLFSTHEQDIIRTYTEVCGRKIELPYNRYYCYCIAEKVDFADEWIDTLKYCNYKNIQVDTIRKMEVLVAGIFTDLAATYEKYGYDYFYNVADEEVNDMCEANDWKFLEDGTFFTK